MNPEIMLVDAARCVGCQTCVVACQMENGLQPGVSWLRVDALEWGAWPHAGRAYVSHGCLHCDDPDCVRVCPTGASFVDDLGAVQVDASACIGCQVCQGACPYGARTVVRETRWFYGAPDPAPYETWDPGANGTAQKCTLCAGRRSRGLEPACVSACPCGARSYIAAKEVAAEGLPVQPVSQRVWYLLPEDAPVDDVREQLRRARGAQNVPKASEAQRGEPRPGAFAATAAACFAGTAGLVGAALLDRKRGVSGDV